MVYYNFNDLPCQKQITDTRFVWHIFIVSFIFQHTPFSRLFHIL